jgi:hypothetical protein
LSASSVYEHGVEVHVVFFHAFPGVQDRATVCSSHRITGVEYDRALTSLGGKPLFVLSADVGQMSGWSAAQEKLSALSTNSVHETAHSRDTRGSLEDRNYAAISSRAIDAVVRSVRTGDRSRASPQVPSRTRRREYSPGSTLVPTIVIMGSISVAVTRAMVSNPVLRDMDVRSRAVTSA